MVVFRFAPAVLIALSAGSVALADTIGSQNFNALDSTGSTTLDEVTNGTLLTNAGSKNIGGAGLDFTTRWFATRPSNTTGPRTPALDGDSSDFIGVNSFSGANNPNLGPTGVAVAAGIEHNFEFNDGDGRLDLVFETVNVASYTGVTLGLKYWINNTTYESDDFFTVKLSDGLGTATVLNYGELDLEGNVSPDDGTNNWKMLLVNVSALGLGNNLTLTVSVDTNASTENVFVDDVLFSGTPVPEPTSLALLALGGLIAARRRA